MPITKKKITKRTAIKLAKQYIEMCNKINLPIQKAFLFGSYSKDTAHADSDIDLLLVSDKFRNNSLDNWKMLSPITAKLYDVEPHPYPVKNFIKGDPFLEEVLKTGIEIVC
jgi:uncharacterized protein